MTGPPPTKRSRSAPSPNTILDRPSLIRALDAAGIVVKSKQIDGFYQCLHRQHYPPLGVFIRNYHLNEAKEDLHDPTPIKNNISRKKNRNRIQLCKPFLKFLADPNNGFVTVSSTVDSARTSKDGTTTKLAIRLHDGHLVESVLMRYISKDGSRASLCVSSQVGCAMGCTFCATATMGIRGNLTCGEILEQIVHADRILAQDMLENESLPEDRKKRLGLVRNVVFMGMGEPLNNYNNVIEACRGLLDRRRWNLGHGKITISTVGVIPKMRALTRDLPEVSLALSLHAPNQEMRATIVPTSTAYKIEGLIDALDNHMGAYLTKTYDGEKFVETDKLKESTRRRAMIEYVMLEGETSSFECAHQLGKLCENRRLVVNLIPYNQTDVKDKLRCPSREHMREFQRIISSYGVFVTTRKTMGADIASACGQLVVKKEKEPKQRSLVDIEDVGKDSSTNKAKGKVQGRNMSAHKAQTKKNQTMVDSDLERLVKPLAYATSVAATCFIVSTALFVMQRKRR